MYDLDNSQFLRRKNERQLHQKMVIIRGHWTIQPLLKYLGVLYTYFHLETLVL